MCDCPKDYAECYHCPDGHHCECCDDSCCYCGVSFRDDTTAEMILKSDKMIVGKVSDLL